MTSIVSSTSFTLGFEGGMMDALVQRIAELFAPWARTDAPGLVVGVAYQGAVIFRSGFGMASLETSVALTPTTKLRIGSTSKHFTALLALLLVEEGKLNLDLPIRTYLPSLTGPGGDPTARQLLQHRGGSRCYLDLGFIGHGMATPPLGSAFAAQQRQRVRNFAPGEATIYNNGGYHLVSMAIEKVGAAPFETQLEERFFAPLGMPNSLGLPSDHRIVPGMATLHVPVAGGGWRRGLFPSEEMRGEGSIVSTVDDMLAWAAHLRRRDRFATVESWRQLVEVPTTRDGRVGVYALGLMVQTYRGLRAVHHAGGVIGGSSQMLTFPDDGLDIVILANGAPGADPTALAERVADIVLEDRLGPKPEETDASQSPHLIGHWWSPDSEVIYTISEAAGALKLGVCGGPGLPMRPEGVDQAVVSAGSLGDIVTDLQLEDGGLAVRFGDTRIVHQRVAADEIGKRAFVAAVLPRTFRSEDGDCALSFTGEAEDNQAIFQDGHGASMLTVEALSATLALARRSVGQLPFAVALSLQKDGGLILSTSRTRFLRFDPV
jgi:CubicO group peptidase (beta-lactamase class C family)